MVHAQKAHAAPELKSRAGGLRIGAVDAVRERDADRAADQLASTGAVRPAWSMGRLSASPSAAGDRTGAAPPIVQEVLDSPGKPLDGATRSFFESGFGHDFSRVRVHTGARATESARAVDASAYTVGHDVVFGDGDYAPHSPRGRRLLAHELAHVAQPEAAPVLRRQPKEQQPAGEIRPLVKKFIEGKATEDEKTAIRQMLVNDQLNDVEVRAIEDARKDRFRDQLVKQIGPGAGPAPGGVRIAVPGASGDVHTFFKAGLELRLSGAAKLLAGGFEGTVETTAEARGTQREKALTVTITPPEGDTALAAYIRTNVFHNAPLEFKLGEKALKALTMVSIVGVIPITLTGDRKATGRGIVITLPQLPSDVTMEVALSQSAERPAVAPPTGAPALPPPRVFAAGGVGSAARDPAAAQGTGQTIGAATVGVDLPLFTDTSNSLIYGGVGLRGTVDTRGGVSGTGALITGLNLNPLTLQVAFEAGIGRAPGAGAGAGPDARSGAVFGAEASIGYRLKHVEIMALASVIGGKDVPGSGSVQVGAAYRF